MRAALRSLLRIGMTTIMVTAALVIFLQLLIAKPSPGPSPEYAPVVESRDFVGPVQPVVIDKLALFQLERGFDATLVMVRAGVPRARHEYLLDGEGSPIEAEIVGRKLRVWVKDPQRVRCVDAKRGLR